MAVAEVRKTHLHIPIALVTGTAKTLKCDLAESCAGITRIAQKPFDLDVVTVPDSPLPSNLLLEPLCSAC